MDTIAVVSDFVVWATSQHYPVVHVEQYDEEQDQRTSRIVIDTKRTNGLLKITLTFWQDYLIFIETVGTQNGRHLTTRSASVRRAVLEPDHITFSNFEGENVVTFKYEDDVQLWRGEKKSRFMEMF